MNWPIEPFARFEWLLVFLGISCGVEATLSYHISSRGSPLTAQSVSQEFQFSMQEFSWLNFVSQTNLCCIGEIYWLEEGGMSWSDHDHQTLSSVSLPSKDVFSPGRELADKCQLIEDDCHLDWDSSHADHGSSSTTICPPRTFINLSLVKIQN